MYAYAPEVRAAFILGINRCAVLQELLDAPFVTLADSIVELCPAWVKNVKNVHASCMCTLMQLQWFGKSVA